jgi:hypothetical protein
MTWRALYISPYPAGPSVPLLLVDDDEVAAEINAAAHMIRHSHSSGAYLANCFVQHLGNCIVPAACNMDDLAAAMEIIDALVGCCSGTDVPLWALMWH